MDLLVGFGLLLLLVIPLALALRRATSLFVLGVRDGRVELSSGQVPPRLLRDIEDVMRRSGAGRATLRVIAEGGRPRVVGTGLDPATLQRLRNVVGGWTVAQIRAGRRKA